MLRRSPPLWLFWVILVWIVSFPWIGFTPEPQWHRVHLVPLSDPADKFRDMVANVLLFLPFGFSAGRRRLVGRAVVRALALAFIVSVIAEGTQLFSTRRYPSATDVSAALLGSLLGVMATVWLRPPSKPATWTDSSVI